MFVAALTGSIATGKSTVSALLTELGAVIIDADVLARQAVAKGSAGLAQVVERFGPRVLDKEGNLDRAAMRARIFADPKARADLEAIIHPIVKAGQERLMDQAAQTDPRAVVVIDIPLLFEVGQEKEFEFVIVAYADRRTQIERLMDRDDYDEQAAVEAVASQMDIEDKRSRADYVIDNSGSPEQTRLQVAELFGLLQARAAENAL